MQETFDITEITVLENIQRHMATMYTAERKVAQFVLDNPQTSLDSNVSELAELSGVSDATVVRFCQKIGYTGFFQMKLRLSHDMGQNRMMQIANGTQENGTARERITCVANTIVSISQNVSSEQFLKCAKAINDCRTAIVVGNGFSKILASDIIYRLTRLGIRCSGGGYAETDFENIHMGQPGDVAIFVSGSGEDAKTLQEMSLASRSGIVTIALTDAAKCPIAQQADIALNPGVFTKEARIAKYLPTSLYIYLLVDILLQYVAQRHTDFEYLAESLSRDLL